MSDYDDSVIADGPLYYLRGDEGEGAAVFLDASGGGHDFPLLPEVALAALFGPIETDPADRAARADPTPVGGFGFFGVARYPDPIPPEIDPRDDLTYECWAYCVSGVYNQALLRSGGVPSGSGVLVGLAGTTAVFKLAFDSDSFTLTKTGLAPDAWYHLVMTRSGNVMRGYVNSVLVVEDTGLPPAEAVEVAVESGWKLGLQAGGDACPGAARWAVYDTALSQTRVSAHYAAAKLAQAVSGMARGSSTAALNSFVTPTPAPFVFRHNWKTEVVERLTKRTAITTARNGREQRGGVRSKHRRQLEYLVDTEDALMRGRLESFLFANQRKVIALPVLTDKARLAEPLSAGATVVPVSTPFLDYNVGGRVMLLDFATGKGETAVIDEVAAGSVTLREGLKNGWAARTTVIAPACRAILERRVNLAVSTVQLAEARIVARVLVEDVPLTPNRFTAWEPTYTYDSLEVFDPFLWGRHDASEDQQVSSEQRGDDYDYDVGVFGAESGTDAPQATFTHRLIFTSRERVSAFLGWWEARSGSRIPLWVPSGGNDFKAVAADGSELTVTGANYLDTYALHPARRDVAFILRDRTMVFARIESAEADGGNEVLTLDAGVPSLADVRRVCFLKRCRLDADALELAWVKLDEVRVTLRFRELSTSG